MRYRNPRWFICKKRKAFIILKNQSYDEETCRLVGEIVNVCADERILDENGKIDLNKFSPITYDPVHHVYRKLGDVVGKAFSDGKSINKNRKKYIAV